MLPNFPGYPGHALQGGRAAVAPVAQPVVMGVPGSGSALPNPGGIPDHLIKFMENVRAGRLIPPPQQGGGFSMPPQIAGMPQMPPPPSGMIDGSPVGGLFQSVQPVAAFDPGRQVAEMPQQAAQGPATHQQGLEVPQGAPDAYQTHLMQMGGHYQGAGQYALPWLPHPPHEVEVRGL